MRAVVYDKPFTVTVREVEKPIILHPDDIIVKGQYDYLLVPFLACVNTMGFSNNDMYLWKVSISSSLEIITTFR